MGKVAKANASVNEARFYKTLSSPPSVYYVEYDVAAPSAAFAARDADGDTRGNGTFDIGSGQDGFFFYQPWIPDAGYWTEATPNGPFTGFTADTWHTILFSYNAGSVAWKIDGTSFDSYTQTITGTSVIAQFGAFGALHISDQIYYIDNVKIGTTVGGTDMFGDDFESGDMSAWETVIGDVTVVDDPGFTRAAGPPGLLAWRRF